MSKELIFILLFLFNIFITIYTIYQLFENIIFFSKEGSMLKIKKNNILNSKEKNHIV